MCTAGSCRIILLVISFHVSSHWVDTGRAVCWSSHSVRDKVNLARDELRYFLPCVLKSTLLFYNTGSQSSIWHQWDQRSVVLTKIDSHFLQNIFIVFIFVLSSVLTTCIQVYLGGLALAWIFFWCHLPCFLPCLDIPSPINFREWGLVVHILNKVNCVRLSPLVHI